MNDASSSGFVRAALRMVRTTLGSTIYAALAFLGAGQINWPRRWVFAALFVGVSVFGTLLVQLANPGLLEARSKGIQKDTKAYDKLFFLMFVPIVVLYPVVAGSDAVRFSWSSLPPWTLWAGSLLFILGSIFGTWTMATNLYAETTVRIQRDRGQTVVAAGPYAWVRHPMYLGVAIGIPGIALILGSAWALIPAGFIVALFIWRTGREDETLKHELPQYKDYANQTRYRLLPGIW